MFNILADSMKLAVLGDRGPQSGEALKRERRRRNRSELEAELRRNPYVEFRDFSR